VFDPNTLPFMVSSGVIDFSARISGLDPIDVPIKQFGLWRSMKKNIIPQEGADMFRQLETSKLEEALGVEDAGRIFDEVGEEVYGTTSGLERWQFKDGTEAARIEVNYPLLTDEGSHGWFPGEQPSRTSRPMDDPYGAAYDELDKIVSETHDGKTFQEVIYEDYGDMSQMKIEETIQHELVHRGQVNDEIAEAIAKGENPPPKSGAGDKDLFGDNLHDDSIAFQNKQVEEQIARQEEIKRIGGDINVQKQAVIDAQRDASDVQKGLADYGDLDPKQRVKVDTEVSKANNRVVAEEGKLDDMRKQMDQTTDQFNDAKKLSTNRSRAEFDATYSAGLKLLAGESVTASVRKAALREAGITSAWRPWLKPMMLEDYLTKPQGRRAISWLAQNDSVAKQRKFLNHGLRGEDQFRLAKANSEAEVIQILAPYLGNELQKAPKVGMSRALGGFMTDNGLPGGAAITGVFEGGVISRITTSLHRMGARQVDLELDMFDIDKTLDHAEAWMRTIRASDDEVDAVLYAIMAESSRPRGTGPPDVTKIYDMLTDLFSTKLTKQLKGQGASEATQARLVDEVMLDFKTVTLEHSKYAQDTAANAIDDVASTTRKVWSDARGADVAVPNYNAVLEAQTSMTHVKLPNVRSVRQATSGAHLWNRRSIDAITNHIPSENKAYEFLKKWRGDGLETTWGFGFMDKAHKVWRDLALLRLGWALRVLPEEMVRQAAAGYGSAFTHPISYLGLMTRHKLANSIVGDDFKSLIGLDDVGSGAFRDTSGAFDASRQAWTSVRNPGKNASPAEILAYKRGVATEYLQLSADPVVRHVADAGIENTLKWMDTADGKKAIRGMNISEMSTAEGRRLYVERAAAMQAQLTGGRWIRRNTQGNWVDMTGAQVTDWRSMTREQLHARINGARQSTGLPPIAAKPTSYPKDYWIDIAVKETGIPVLSEFDGTYVITKQGDADMRNVFANGVDQHGQRIQYPEMKMKSDHDWDIQDFSDRLAEMYDELDIVPPEQVRVPRNALDNSRATYDSSVDAIFQSLMAKPSAILNRNPYFKQRYADDMARTYLFADADLRRHLLKWADDNNYLSNFRKSIKTQANEAGMVKVPRPGRKGKAFGMDDMDQVDTLARQRGLKDTKDLFYDLAERNNITDMMKFVFPFADAWYEVLSRWAGLMFTDATRAPTNWRRSQVGIANVRKSGFFQEDEYGNEVFNWPGAGVMAPWMTNTPDNMRMGSSMSLDKLMFIDPNPRGIMMPGVGPFIQSPASMFTFATEQLPEIQNAVNWFAFGDYERGQPQNLGDAIGAWVPSWARQAVDAVFADEGKQEFADEIGAAYEMMIQSGDPEFAAGTEAEFRKTHEAAQTFGTVLSWLKVADRFIAPATPTYDPELLIVDGPDKEFWMSSGSLARELRAATDFFDDSDKANQYFEARFGLNPFKVGSDTYTISNAPLTETPFEFLRSNQEMYDLAPLSMMAWLTIPDDEDFFAPARQTALDEGQIVRVTTEQRAFAINESLGWNEWNNVRDQTDEWEAQIKANTQPRTDRRTLMMDAVAEWKRRRRDAIFEEYWAWDNQQNRANVGLGEKAKPEDIWDELTVQGTPGTESYKFTRGISEEMSDWVVGFAGMTNKLFDASLEMGDRNWWLTSKDPQAIAVRQGFVDELELSALEMSKDGHSKVAYVMERWIQPVMTDHEFDEQLWLIPNEVEDPGEPVWADGEPNGSVPSITFKSDRKQLQDAGGIMP
jgi:hypothetical protein